MPDKPNTLANWTGPHSGVPMIGQTLDCKRWASLLSATKEGGAVGFNTAGEV